MMTTNGDDGNYDNGDANNNNNDDDDDKRHHGRPYATLMTRNHQATHAKRQTRKRAHPFLPSYTPSEGPLRIRFFFPTGRRPFLSSSLLFSPSSPPLQSVLSCLTPSNLVTRIIAYGRAQRVFFFSTQKGVVWSVLWVRLWFVSGLLSSLHFFFSSFFWFTRGYHREYTKGKTVYRIFFLHIRLGLVYGFVTGASGTRPSCT